MITSIVVCDPVKFKIYTSEAIGFYPVISMENEDTRQELRVLLKDYSQLETLIAILKDHYEDFITRESESAGT